MNESTRFKEWIIRAEFSRDTEHLELERFTRPLRVAGKNTPCDLNDLTIGQMVQLSECKNGKEMFYLTCEVLLSLTRKEVDECFAVDIVRFCGWVLSQVKIINTLFDSVKGKPSKEEELAGINELKFGVFGLIDWYALRMGITDHEEVTKVTWGRVYKCLEMDNKTKEFKERLAKIYKDEH